MDALNAMMYFVQDREPSSFNDLIGEQLSLLVTFFLVDSVPTTYVLVMK